MYEIIHIVVRKNFCKSLFLKNERGKAEHLNGTLVFDFSAALRYEFEKNNEFKQFERELEKF